MRPTNLDACHVNLNSSGKKFSCLNNMLAQRIQEKLPNVTRCFSVFHTWGWVPGTRPGLQFIPID